MAEHRHWDVIVIGGGLAGSVSAAELAGAGLSVLVLEAGRRPVPAPPGRGGFASRILGKLLDSGETFHPGRWPEQMTVRRRGRFGSVRSTRFPAFLGTGPGGGSLIYGAALGRLRRDDFLRDSASGAGGLANDWPVSWDEFTPFYAEAERLMRIAGTADETDPDGDGSVLAVPPPIGPRDAAFAARLRANGRHPYRLHVGFDYRPGCTECLGHPCVRGCKADGMSRALGPALEAGKVALREAVRVARVEPDAAGGFSVTSEAGERFNTAHVVLAAGALQSPGILARSPALWPAGEAPALLGRGLMFHAADIFAVFDPEASPVFGPRKTLAFRDHYRDGDMPLGEVQSMGPPITAGTVAGYLIDTARRAGLGWLGPVLQAARIPAAIGARMFRNATLFATVLEDLPYAENRVLGNREGIVVDYRVTTELRVRGKRLRGLVRDAFAPNRVVFLSPPATPNWGHPCGTCRMGQGPESSVTNPAGQLWGVPGIVIADAAAFPSSGGTNPGLTIVANAIRVSRALAARITSAAEQP